jgi:demethylmenaquinone methyltransferase / 2-methoxy-6-polyprenyl-1,4-benzoquinol methylase
VWRAAVRAANLKTSSRVLDLCAGTGDLSLALARQGRPAEVVGTDFVPEMLAVAEQKARGFSGSHQDLVLGRRRPGPALPGLLVRRGDRGVRRAQPTRPHANFAEVIRVLKPGGRYVILEFSRPSFAPWRWFYHLYLRLVIPAIGGLLTRDRASFVYLNDSIRSFPAQAVLSAELRAAGFTAISWEDRTGGVVAIHTAVK